MSTDIKTHKAVVHAADASTGIVYVKIPAVTGQKIVKVSREGLTEAQSTGMWNVPRVGDVCLVALSRDNSDVSWVSGMYADLYRVDDNWVNTSKLVTDAIKSLNYTTIWDQGLGSITASSKTFTASSGTFTSLMINSPITVNGAGAGGAPLITTIAGYTSSSVVTLTAAAATTATSQLWVVNPRNLWSYTGSFFDLDNGNISTPGLSMDGTTGLLAVQGDVTASRFTLTDTFGVNRSQFTSGAPVYAPDGSPLPNTDGANQLDFSSSILFPDNPPIIYGTRSHLGWNNKTGQVSLRADNGSGGYGSITSGQDTFTTDAPGAFTTAMVGSVITIAGAGFGGAPLVTTIAALSGTTIVTLASGASTTVSNALWSLVSEGFGSITSGSSTFNTTSGQVFNSAMVGATITIKGAGPSGTDLVAVIATYLTVYSVTLSTTASTTVVASAWTLTHAPNRSQQLILQPAFNAALHSVDSSLGATSRRSYVSVSPVSTDIIVLSGVPGYQQRIYTNTTSVNIYSDALTGGAGNYLGNINLNAATTAINGALTVSGAGTFSGTTGMWITNFGSTSTFNGPVTVNNNAIQFNSQIGNKINLFGTDYRISIASNTMVFDSAVQYQYWIANSLRYQFLANAIVHTGTQGGQLTFGNVYAGTWNGVSGANGYLLMGNETANSDGKMYLRTNGPDAVIIGAQSSNTLTVGNGASTFSGTLTSGSLSTGNIGAARVSATATPTGSWDTAGVISNGSGNSSISLHPGGFAGQFRQSTVGGDVVYCRNADDSAYIQLNADHVDFSNSKGKQDLTPWSGALDTGDIPDPLEALRLLNPVFFRYKKEHRLGGMLLSPRRQAALDRLNSYKESRGEELHDASHETTHLCGRDCWYQPHDPCERVRDWESGALGLVAEDVGAVLPSLASLDPHTGEFEGLRAISVATVAIAACQKLLDRIEVLESMV